MCRLLGMVANKPVDIEFSLRLFKRLATKNPDGWGIGWFDDGKAQLFRQGISMASQRSRFRQVSKRITSRLVIAHVRKGTGARRAEWNSHPFQYGNWLFAHNGKLDRKHLWSKLDREHRNYVKGGTDSEVYFLWIMQNVELEKSFEEGVRIALEEVLKSEYSGLNFVMSNERDLYAFRYGKKPGDRRHTLFVLRRRPSDSHLFEYLSEETRAVLRSKSLRGEEAVLVCSEKLTREPWKPVGFGTMIRVGPGLRTRELDVV